MRFLERLRQVAQNRQRFENAPDTHAGEDAELQLLQSIEGCIEAVGGEGYWRVWRGVRVPAKKGRQTEIDFVVSTHAQVFLIELKNWSGQLELDGDTLVQIRRYEGGIVRHGDLMRKMDQREVALRAWVEQTMRTAPPIERRILFYNPRLQMSGDVRSYFGGAVASASEWLQELSELRRSSTPVSDEMARFHKAMDQLGSWDRLELHGGKQLVGDILDEGKAIEFSTGLRTRLSDRKRFFGLDFEAPRSYFMAVLGLSRPYRVRAQLRGGGTLVETLPADAAIKFHPAGQPSPEWVPVRHIRHLRFGYSVRRRGPRQRF